MPGKPSKPRRAQPDRKRGGRRNGHELLHADFQFFEEMARQTRRAKGKKIHGHADGAPLPVAVYPKVFATSKRLTGQHAPQFLGVLTKSWNAKSRYYYVDRRSGSERREGQESMTPGGGSRTLFVAPGVTPAELKQHMLERVFESARKVEGARLLGGFLAEGPQGATPLGVHSYLYAERRERRRGQRRQRTSERFFNYTLADLVNFESKQNKYTPYIVYPAAGISVETPIGRMFESKKKLRGRRLLAIIKDTRNRPLYVYADQRMGERRQPP